MQLHDKTRKFRRSFYRWYHARRLDKKFGRAPTDAEIDDAIFSEKTSKYGAANAKHALEVIAISAEQYSRIAQFPMKFKECLRRVVGRRSYGENLPIFKAFHRHFLKSIAIKNCYPAREQTDEYADQQTIERIEWLQRVGVDRGEYETYLTEIPLWRKEHRQKPQRSNAANSRWLKTNRKNILTLLVKRINAIPHQ